MGFRMARPRAQAWLTVARLTIARRALIFLAVVLMLSACGASPATQAPSDTSASALRIRETWMGLYLNTAKIGWSRTAIEHPEAGRFRLVNETFMRMVAMGTVQESTMLLTVDFTPSFQPLAYRFTLTTPAFRSEASGEVLDGVLHTRLVTPGGERKEDIPLGDHTDLFGLADLRHAADGYHVGDVFSGEIFEPNLFGLTPYRIEVIDTQIVKLSGSPETVFRVKSSISGIESLSVVDASGDPIRSDGPMGIVMKRETPEDARDLGKSGNVMDLIMAFSLDAGAVVENPAGVRRAVLVASGLGDAFYDGGAQVVSPADSAGLRRVVIDLDSPPAVAPPDSERLAALRPSPTLQSDDSRVVARARQITAGARTPRDKVQRLFRWVHENMHAEPAFTLPSTVDVLLRMRGDCNEHAALFGGLARAAGVPCRIAAGLVYMQGRFYYHAWNEVWLGGRWVPVDATFGENPAGALRLRLAVGDLAEQMRIAALAGKLKVTIREVR